MKSKLAVIATVSFIFVLLTGTGLIVRTQISNGQQNETPLMKKIREKPDPVAEYDSPEPADPKERVLRQRRNVKFGAKRSEGLDQFALTENSSEFLYSTSFSTHTRPAFPISKDRLIVVGKIVEAKAFLNENKSSIYSEFTLNVEDVLKRAVGSNFTKENKENIVTFTRPGGRVRLPSGRILYRGHYGVELPEVGKRYLLFLTNDNETESFNLNTAYELQGGTVLPLDGLYNNEVMESYSKQYEFKGMDEAGFINIVRTKIAEFENGGSK